MKTNENRQRFWHKLGLSLSLLCSIHCLAMPFVVLLMPYFGSVFSSEYVEWGFMSVSLVLAGVLLRRDYLYKHGHYLPLTFLGIAVASILVNHFGYHHFLIEMLTGLLMASAFVSNWYHGRAYHRCEVQHD